MGTKHKTLGQQREAYRYIYQRLASGQVVHPPLIWTGSHVCFSSSPTLNCVCMVLLKVMLGLKPSLTCSSSLLLGRLAENEHVGCCLCMRPRVNRSLLRGGQIKLYLFNQFGLFRALVSLSMSFVIHQAYNGEIDQ